MGIFGIVEVFPKWKELGGGELVVELPRETRGLGKFRKKTKKGIFRVEVRKVCFCVVESVGKVYMAGIRYYF